MRLKIIASLANDPAISNHEPPNPLPPVISTVYSAGGLGLPMFSAIAQFGGAEDLTITDLKIELIFPADTETAAFFESLS